MEKIKLTEDVASNLQLKFSEKILLLSLVDPNLSYKNNVVDTVYHYTDLIGLLGIVQNQCIWATSINHLNDSKEFEHGVEIIEEIIESYPNAAFENYIKLLKQKLYLIYNTDRFVACLSKQGDLLSQWRAYGNNGSGVSIGFNRRNLKNSFASLLNEKFIVYDTSKQKSIIKRIIDEGIEFFESQKQFIDPGKYSWEELTAVTIIQFLEEVISSYKNESFSEEQEYRLEKRVENFQKEKELKNLKLRTNNRMIIPYCELECEYHYLKRIYEEGEPLPTLVTERLPIEEVIVGPSLDINIVLPTLKLLFQKAGYESIQISQSKIPYRV